MNTPKKPSSDKLVGHEINLTEILLSSVDRGELLAAIQKIQLGWEDFIQRAFGGREHMSAVIAAIARNMAEFAEKLPEAEEMLAATDQSIFEIVPDQHGWFFDAKMLPEFVFEAVKLQRAGDGPGLDDRFCLHYRDRFEDIEAEVARRHPKRREALAAAFAAHRKGHYVLSIPVLLAQADGVSRDLIGSEFSTFRKTEPHLAALLAEVKDDLFLSAVLRGLSRPGRVRLPSGDASPGEFNRHAILHGVEPNYGTETNSLKAVSLLNFMSQNWELVSASRNGHVVPR